MNAHCGNQLQNGLITHALDREADRTQIKFACEYLPTHLLYNVLGRISILCHCDRIVERESTVFVNIRHPKIIFNVVIRPIGQV